MGVFYIIRHSQHDFEYFRKGKKKGHKKFAYKIRINE